MKFLYKLLVFVLVSCLVFVAGNLSAVYFINRQKNLNIKPIEQIVIEGKSIDISGVELTHDLKTEENGDIFLYDGQTKRQVTYLNNPISQLNFSMAGDKFGYFVNYNIYDKNIAYDKETILRIEDVSTRESKEVFHGSFRTDSWEWFSNDEVLVSEACGTECYVESLIDLKFNKEYDLQYGIDYTWSLDKKWVFAYNYSDRTGITVGDKFGQIILRYNIIPSENEIANTPLAVWSPNSSKLALVMKKSDDKEFELVIFDSNLKFKRIFRSNVNFTPEFRLIWDNGSKKIYLNDKEFSF